MFPGVLFVLDFILDGILVVFNSEAFTCAAGELGRMKVIHITLDW